MKRLLQKTLRSLQCSYALTQTVFTPFRVVSLDYIPNLRQRNQGGALKCQALLGFDTKLSSTIELPEVYFVCHRLGEC